MVLIANQPRYLRQFMLWPILMLAACSAGDGSGLDDNGRPIGESDNGGPLIATLDSIQDNVFTPICTFCHIGAAAPQGLRLDEGNSFSHLVGISSSEVPGILRVAPGDPDLSYLVQKLEGTAAVGEQMPFGGPPLPQSTIDVIRQWIIDGAIASSNLAQSKHSLNVTGFSPMHDTTTAALPAQILVVFNKDVDASTIHSESVVLWRAGGDGSFGQDNDIRLVTANVGVNPLNPSVVILKVSAFVSEHDRYRIFIAGNAVHSVLDLDGNSLGHDIVSEFDVSGNE